MKPSASEDKENDENHVKSRTPRSMEHAVDNIIAAGEYSFEYIMVLLCLNFDLLK